MDLEFVLLDIKPDPDADPIEVPSQELYFQNVKKKICSNEDFPCAICNRNINGYLYVIDHYRGHGLMAYAENKKFALNYDISKYFRCTKCLMEFLNKNELNKHEQEFHKLHKFMCAVCNQCFVQDLPFIFHVETHRHEPLKFPEPNINELSPEEKNGSILLKLLDKKKDNRNQIFQLYKKFDCIVCKEQIAGYTPLMDHYDEHVRKKKEENRQLIESDSVENDLYHYRCKICLMNFEKKEGLADHENGYHDKYAHMCAICNKCFLNRGSLLTHLDTHRDDYEPLKCSQCNFTTAYPSALGTHMNAMHPKTENPHKCKVCGAEFLILKELFAHNREAHGIFRKGAQQKTFKCPDCDKEFKLRCMLKKHSAVHSEVKKRTICDICGKSVCPSHLLSHKRRHLGIKPYACTFCNKSFVVKSILDDHLKTHSGEKPFSCEYCGKGFTQRTPLKTHQRLHTGERPYTCIVCKKGFVSKSSMQLHMKQGKHDISE